MYGKFIPSCVVGCWIDTSDINLQFMKLTYYVLRNITNTSFPTKTECVCIIFTISLTFKTRKSHKKTTEREPPLRGPHQTLAKCLAGESLLHIYHHDIGTYICFILREEMNRKQKYLRNI